MSIGGNSDYLGGRPVSLVKFATIDNDYSEIEIEFEDIDEPNTDIEVGAYLVNRSLADDYRDSERTEERDAFIVFAKTNEARMRRCKNGRGGTTACVAFRQYGNKLGSSRKKRFRNNDSRNVSENWHA